MRTIIVQISLGFACVLRAAGFRAGGGDDRSARILETMDDDGITEDKKSKIDFEPADSSPFIGTCSPDGTTCEKKVWDVNQKSEIITREGLGENLGLPGIAFLGAGYNIFEGNPRGTDDEERDPGKEDKDK